MYKLNKTIVKKAKFFLAIIKKRLEKLEIKKKYLIKIGNIISNETNMSFKNISLEKIYNSSKQNIIMRISSDQNDKYIVKISLTSIGFKNALSQHLCLQKIHNEVCLDIETKQLIPKPVYQGSLNGNGIFIETFIDGINAKSSVKFDNKTKILLKNGSKILCKLGSFSALEKKIDHALYTKKIKIIIDKIKQLDTKNKYRHIFEMIDYDLRKIFIDQLFPFMWSHGDFRVSNIILNKETFNIVGIIDWNPFEKDGLPLLDLLSFIDSIYLHRNKYHLGKVIVEVFLSNNLMYYEMNIIEDYLKKFDIEKDYLKHFIILYWMKHIYSQIDYKIIKDKNWLELNYYNVLKYLNEH